jgi:hypothetical protein
MACCLIKHKDKYTFLPVWNISCLLVYDAILRNLDGHFMYEPYKVLKAIIRDCLCLRVFDICGLQLHDLIMVIYELVNYDNNYLFI